MARQRQSLRGMWGAGNNLFSATHYLFFSFLFFLFFWMELLRIYKPQGSLAGTNSLSSELSESSRLLII